MQTDLGSIPVNEVVATYLRSMGPKFDAAAANLSLLSGQVANLTLQIDRLIALQSRGPGRPKIDHPPQICAAGAACPRPGGIFTPRRKDQMYCSDPCKLVGARAVKARHDVAKLIDPARPARRVKTPAEIQAEFEAQRQAQTTGDKTPEQEARFLARVKEVGLAQALQEEDDV